LGMKLMGKGEEAKLKLVILNLELIL